MDNNFATNLKLLRESMSLSQNEIAKSLNITRQTISNYEKGIRQPDMFALVKISEFFSCSIDELIFGSSNFDINELNTFKEIDILLNKKLNNSPTLNVESIINQLKSKKIEIKKSIDFLYHDLDKIDIIINYLSDPIFLKNKNINVEYSEELVPNIKDCNIDKKVQNLNDFKSKKINGLDLDFYKNKYVEIYDCLSYQNKNTTSIPKVGNISAGTPMYACEDIERYFNLSIDDLSYPVDEYFILQVNGESMNKIYKDKDYILVHKTRGLVPNKPMIALVDGEDATMKYVEITDCDFTLIPHSNEKHFEPVTYSTSEYKLDILGEVVGVINELKEE